MTIIKKHEIRTYNMFNQEMFDYIRSCQTIYNMRIELNKFFERKFKRKKLIQISDLQLNIKKNGPEFEIESRDHFTSMLLQGLYIRELYNNNEGRTIVKDGVSLYYWHKYEKRLYSTTGTIGSQTILEMTDKNRLWVFNRVSDEYMKKVLELL